MGLRIVVEAGWIASRSDRDWHYIGVGQLLRLYRVPPGTPYVVKGDLGYRASPDDIRLYPRYDYPDVADLGREAA